MNTEIEMRGTAYNESPEVVIHHMEALDREAELAIHFIDRWGMICGESDGEDSAGRAKIRTSTAQEIVTKAFDIAHLALEEARTRGLVLRLPSLAEREAFNADFKAKKKAAKETV